MRRVSGANVRRIKSRAKQMVTACVKMSHNFLYCSEFIKINKYKVSVMTKIEDLLHYTQQLMQVESFKLRGVVKFVKL